MLTHGPLAIEILVENDFLPSVLYRLNDFIYSLSVWLSNHAISANKGETRTFF